MTRDRSALLRPTASLLVVNHDADSTKGDADQITVDLSLTLPEPMDSPTSVTATIDGPAATGVPPGVAVGIVSDPPSAGPSTGLLCVDVVVRSGAGVPFFGFVSPIIRVVDPFDGTVLAERRGLDTTMQAYSTRTFTIGPIARDPWVPLAVSLTEDQGDVITWDADASSC